MSIKTKEQNLIVCHCNGRQLDIVKQEGFDLTKYNSLIGLCLIVLLVGIRILFGFFLSFPPLISNFFKNSLDPRKN